MIEKRFPKEFKKRSKEIPKEEYKRTTNNAIPLYIRKDLVMFPGAVGVITDPEMKYSIMFQNAMMGTRVFGMLSYYNDKWLGSLLEITNIDLQNNMIVRVLAKERFIVESIYPNQDESLMIDINLLTYNDLDEESLYFGTPIFIRDRYEAEPHLSLEVLNFVDGCINLVGIDEQRNIRSLFIPNCDRSFFAIHMLNITPSDVLTAYFSTSRLERYQISHRFIQHKTIDKALIKATKDNFIKAHLNSLMILLAFIIVLFFGKAY